ncbi:hypothetical protein SUVZ_14G3110 [Saccharomyces uvarum]|uniref:Asi3p n=1 Tax=Saccharomyces uvarum TaxID=230603 RepID=A0ABN8WJV5_SACUV|nr:hypothetical protein SUVZ_14G3110 [Saccharomyces uvarum]
MMPTNIVEQVKLFLNRRDILGAFYNKTGNTSTLAQTAQDFKGYANLNSTTVSSTTFDSLDRMLRKGDFTIPVLIKTGIKIFFSYSVSKYAVLCFCTAIMLNRLSVMSSLRSNSTNIRLPLWSKTLLHLVAALSLISAFSQISGQFGFINKLHTDDMDAYALSVYLLTILSDCIEIFISSTTNAIPLKSSDFSIWGLSLNLYIISKLPVKQQHMGDNVKLLAAVSHRLVIHLLELLHLRTYRLFADAMLNVGFFASFIARAYLNGLDFISICLIHNFFPSFAYILVILLASVGNFLKALCTGNLLRSLSSSYEPLAKWWKSNSYSGEEEFNEIALSLCLLLTTNDRTVFKKFVKDTQKPVDKAAALSNSYMVSGYLNQLQSTPEDMLSHKEMTTDSQLPSFINTYLDFFQLVKAISLNYFQLLKGLVWNKNLETYRGHKSKGKKSKKKDLNRYITEKNYKKFLYKPDVKDFDSGSDPRCRELLLPEDDLSKNYVPPRENNDSVSDEEFDNDGESQMIMEEKEELTRLSTNPVGSDNIKDLAWNLSMWSILKYEMDENNKIEGPLTRSQYGKKNSEGILADTVIERLLHQTNSSHIYRRLEVEEDKKSGFQFDFPLGDCDEMDNIDLACLICKANKRNIVTWPCRCLTLCDECRILLGYKGFDTCVSCDSDVKGYSKLNIV